MQNTMISDVMQQFNNNCHNVTAKIFDLFCDNEKKNLYSN